MTLSTGRVRVDPDPISCHLLRHVKTRMVVAAIALIAAPAGCGGRRRESPELAYLRVGVSPRAEASALARSLERGGYRLVARYDGERYSALGLLDASLGRTAVRVITRRGTAVALDAPGGEVAAVELERAPARDVDGDGTEDVIVGARERGLDRTCLVVVRVLASGEALALPTEAARVDRDACLEALEDIDGDGRLEGLAVSRWIALARGAPPRIAVPLHPCRRAGYCAPAVGADRPYWRREAGRRRALLARARQGLDVEASYKLAIELAAIARREDAPTGAQVSAFDDAMRGLVLTPGQARSLACTRAFIAAGWRARRD